MNDCPQFVLPPPLIPSIAVTGAGTRFAVRRIVCVGRNYAAHAREMGANPDRESPFFFLKPADCLVDSGATIPYPPDTAELHHEVELVVALREGGSNIPSAQALTHIWGYTVGLDLTRRDLQAQAKAQGRPWDWGKGFDNAAPCGPLNPAEAIGHPARGRIWLEVNGVIKQHADLGDLIWSVPELIAAISSSIALAPGDLIYTGTPSGVGSLDRGDVVTAGVDGVAMLRLTIAA